MSDGLFGFIFNTLLPRVNDPGNAKYWLPARLAEMGNPKGPGRLLPLKEKDWDLGDVKGEGGTIFTANIANGWYALKTANSTDTDWDPIACPERPLPHLAMPEVTMLGLDNARVLDKPKVEQPGFGYRAGITIQFGAYDPAAHPQLSTLKLVGRWQLSQCVCRAASGATVCDKNFASETITGTGPITVELTSVFADATIEIATEGAGRGRTVAVRVAGINLRGATPSDLPVMRTTLDIDSSLEGLKNVAWLPTADQVLSAPDGQAAIIANVNETLNQSGNLRQLSDLLTGQFNRAFDDTIGPARGDLPSGQQAPNPVDLYLFDRIRHAVSDPGSQFYLPKVVANFSSPKLEPFTTDAIDLGTHKVLNADAQITMSKVSATGFSNGAIPPENMTFRPDQTDATVLVGTLTSPPAVSVNGSTVQVPAPPLRITGNFDVTLRGKTLPPVAAVFTINRAQVALAIHFDGPDADHVVITFRGMRLAVALSDIAVKLTVDSGFANTINAIANQDSVKQRVIDAINEGAAGHLDEIGRRATDNARKIIAQRLG
jgi:hypothetical protein